MRKRVGIIGGSGLYRMEGLEIEEEREVETPFGKPSAPVSLGRLAGAEVAFLPRHGVHHDILPSEINYRANIWALKECGAGRLISVSATGSLEQDIAPGELAVPSQYFDWTRGRRAGTFFGEGLVAHVSTAEPACPTLTARVVEAARSMDLKIHTGKTYACVEGPRLGTRGESFFLRSAGCHLVGMTNLPEAFLAREAQLCYCTIAIPTDYDCWQDDPSEHVSAEKVFALYARTLGKVQALLKQTLSRMGQESILRLLAEPSRRGGHAQGATRARKVAHPGFPDVMSSSTGGAIAVFVKTPGLSPVKTRLAESIGREEAERVYSLCLRETENAVREAARVEGLEAYWAVAEGEGMDHPLWQGLGRVPQGEGELGDRLHRVYAELLRRHPFAILIGADSPQVSPRVYQDAARQVRESGEFVLGPALDGGFYLFGGGCPLTRETWLSVPYSHEKTAEILSRELRRVAPVRFLPSHFDIDRVEDLIRWCASR